MTWQEKKKSEVKKQSLEKNSDVTHVATTEGESHYLYACIYNVDQFLARLIARNLLLFMFLARNLQHKHKEKTRNNTRNKIRALL